MSNTMLESPLVVLRNLSKIYDLCSKYTLPFIRNINEKDGSKLNTKQNIKYQKKLLTCSNSLIYFKTNCLSPKIWIIHEPIFFWTCDSNPERSVSTRPEVSHFILTSTHNNYSPSDSHLIPIKNT